MAFFVELSSNNGATVTRQLQWHIGTRTPKKITGEKVLSLMADGDELEFINARFRNVPYCHPITQWEGEMANFIFTNLQGLQGY